MKYFGMTWHFNWIAHHQPIDLSPKETDRLRARHYSMRTEKAYVHWIRRYILLYVA